MSVKEQLKDLYENYQKERKELLKNHAPNDYYPIYANKLDGQVNKFFVMHSEKDEFITVPRTSLIFDELIERYVKTFKSELEKHDFKKKVYYL